MDSDDELLEAAARDGELERSKWFASLPSLLSRLDHIVHNEFPIPAISLSDAAAQPRNLATGSGEAYPSVTNTASSRDTDGGPALPSGSSPSPATGMSSLSGQAVIPDSQPSDLAPPQGSLPPQLLALYMNIKGSLRTSFADAPPFTVQRLAELALMPSAHYRTLPSYLRALDRVISVSSAADSFPLPSRSVVEAEGNGNSVLSSSTARALADDFNGAVLTRIPWLRDPGTLMMSSERPLASDLRTESTSLIDGPNGAGSIETVTVSVNGFSGAGLGDANHRQEATAPLSSSLDQNVADNQGDVALIPGSDEDYEEDRVHARGPEEIGMKDTGPQHPERTGHVFDVEAAVGRPGEAERMLPSTGEGALGNDGNTLSAELSLRNEQIPQLANNEPRAGDSSEDDTRPL